MRPFVTVFSAAVLTLSACTPGTDRPQTLESEVIARTMLSIWETADTAAVLELFWPEAVYDDFPNQTQYQGESKTCDGNENCYRNTITDK